MYGMVLLFRECDIVLIVSTKKTDNKDRGETMTVQIATTTALLTDKYELTMISAALKSGVAHKKAVFEAFTRRLPAGRKYFVTAGTERILDAIKNFRFTPQQIEFLREDGINEETLDYLRDYTFSGDIIGFPEGSLFFPYSPVLTVKGTFLEGVLLETVILSILNYDCAVASAASRMVNAADGIPLQELGARRAHEIAAVSASRAAFIAGFHGTSNLEAGMAYGIPVFGTAAHAFTLAHHTEKEAFEAQVAALGTGTTLLVDTYDIAEGIRTAIEVAGTDLGAIRIDSGDLFEETVKARELLDSLGATKTRIVISSDVDEFVIEELLHGHTQAAPVDAFGAGTRVVTGSGHPTIGMVYKLVAIEDEDGSMRPVAKAASGKKSVGGEKVALNFFNEHGMLVKHMVAPASELLRLDGELMDNLRDQGAAEAQSLLVDEGVFLGNLAPHEAVVAAATRHAEARWSLSVEAKTLGAAFPHAIRVVGLDGNDL